MKTHTRVLIIGSGIVGASTAYHLTQMGWGDVVVLDMGPLYKNLGSTSHAPGLIFQHNNSKAVCTLAQWSVETYLQAEKAAHLGQTVFQTGSLEVAHTPERWQELKRKFGNAQAWGLDAQLIGPEEVKRLVPIMKVDDLLGAFYVPSDCDVRGVKVVESLAQLAKAGGAEFYANTPVVGVEIRNGRAVAVQTAHGRIEAEHIVCAAGLWGPIVGRMAGLNLPMTPCQHLYVKTAPLAELAGETEEVRHPIVRYQDRDLYFRQHGEGYGLGSYAHDPHIVFADDLRADDRPAVYPALPEHVAEAWQFATERFPAFAKTQVTEAFNGCFSFTTDGNTLFGETPEVRNFIVAEAVWVTHAGGTAKAVANLLVNGDPGLDLRELDVNRFHAHATSKKYIRARAERQYIEVYDIIHQLQQMENPRGLRVSPFYARQKELGAYFFESAGWERPQWYSANEKYLHWQGERWPARSGWTARYWSPVIGMEHLATRERAGLFDLTAFAKIEVSGSGAFAYLQRLTANQMDQPIGRTTYTALLNEQGGIKCDLTVTRLGADRFWMITGGGTLPMDLAWLKRHLPTDGSVQLSNVSSAYCAVGVWGPRARDIVQAVSENDLSNDAFPYLTAQPIFVGYVPTMAVRISYAGELGWELYTPTEYGSQLWDTLWQAGQPLGMVPVGGGAFDSLRLEKGYRLWGAELHTDYNPLEAGLGFAVRFKKGDFLGRAALEKAKAAGLTRKLCCLTLDDPTVVVMGKEPIYADDGRVVSYVTSANYGYSVKKSLAYAYLPIALSAPGTPVEIYFYGQRHAATVSAEPLYDPANEKIKA